MTSRGYARGYAGQLIRFTFMQLISRRDWSQLIIVLLVVIVCALSIVWFQQPQLQQLQNRSQAATAATIQRDTAAEQVRLQVLQNAPNFGFGNLLADWTFLNFLQYFGDEVAREKTDYRLSPDYFEVVLKHNPYFLQAYTFLSTSTSIYAGQPERTVEIANQALQSLGPDKPSGSYYALRQLGIDQLLFLGDAEAARQSFAKAAEWARASSTPESDRVAALSQQTADFLASNPDSKYAQIAAWSMVLTSVPDDRTRETAIDRIQALGGEIVEQPNGAFSIVPPEQD
ncbi:MAG: hypothetical protein Kow00121_65600 [Elainellaceae cyanobacterium]